MAAHIQKYPDLSILSPPHDDWIFPHIASDKISSLGTFRLMGDEEPAPGIDPLKLSTVDFRVNKNPGTDHPLLCPDQILNKFAAASDPLAFPRNPLFG
jgi:hypothetical protein